MYEHVDKPKARDFHQVYTIRILAPRHATICAAGADCAPPTGKSSPSGPASVYSLFEDSWRLQSGARCCQAHRSRPGVSSIE